MSRAAILQGVARYYTERVESFGPSPRGVDWNSPESQALRFAQLARLLDGPGPWSVADYGCGYGALVDYLEAQGYTFSYQGFDVSEAMLQHARQLHPVRRDRRFTSAEADLAPADYTLASGVFNVKLDVAADAWQAYVLDALATLDRLSRRGFAFNVLTSYSDPERLRPDLYYADPCFYFDYCKRRFSQHVTLVHDYGLYEFTLLVRREPAVPTSVAAPGDRASGAAPA